MINLQRGRLATARQWLALGRHYWRCENEGYWTSDAIFAEDTRRTPWPRDSEAVYVMSFLRAMAQNILAVLRHMVQRTWTTQRIPWSKILLQVQLVFRQRLDVATEVASSS